MKTRRRAVLFAATAALVTAALCFGAAPGQAQEWRGWNIHAAD